MRRPPHLPFLAGPPDFVVGLRPIDPARWLAPDVEADTLPEKCALIDAEGDAVFRTLPESVPAQVETAALMNAADFAAAGRAVSDDLCIMEKRGDMHVLTAAIVCAPSFWDLADVIGQPLSHIHGPVPDRLGADGARGLAQRISRIFDGLAPDMVLERFNWTVQATNARYTPNGAPLRAIAEAARDDDALDLLHLRVERQTIRKLPESRAVLFTIRVSLDSLRAVFREDGARSAFAAAWAAAPEHVRTYKKWAPYERLVAAALANN